jgi:hypothetical protein
MRVFRMFLSAALILLASATTREGQISLAQADCTIMIQPGQSLQKAIDSAPEGAVICLSVGTFEESSITIYKSLTLQGTGSEKTILKAKDKDKPVIKVGGTSEIRIEDLAATGAVDSAGLFIHEKSKVTLIRLNLSNNLYGLIAVGLVKVSLKECEISNNGIGILVDRSAQVDLTNCLLFAHRSTGLMIGEFAVLTMANSSIFDNSFDGVSIGSFSSVYIENSRVYSNRGFAGVTVGGVSPSLSIVNSQIYSNETTGLLTRGSAVVEVRNSSVTQNGITPYCLKPDFICNGIDIEGEVELILIDSTVKYNADWGISAPLKQCGYDMDYFFIGGTIFEGKNEISSNNVSGNQNGLGNPGNHPWNRPDLPDGQVCLP